MSKHRIREKNTLEGRILATYKRNRRAWAMEAVRYPADQRKTAHMRLAEEFGVPCQTVLDIIDPDRSKQDARMKRHLHRKYYRDLQDRCLDMVDEWCDNTTTVERLREIQTDPDFVEYAAWLDVSLNHLRLRVDTETTEA